MVVVVVVVEEEEVSIDRDRWSEVNLQREGRREAENWPSKRGRGAPECNENKREKLGGSDNRGLIAPRSVPK